MGRPSKLHFHKGVWESTIAGKTYYFGADERKARGEFHRVMVKSLASPATDRPETVAGAITAWSELHPSASQARKLRPFLTFAGRTFLDEVGRDIVTRYVIDLRRAKYQPGGPANAKKTADDDKPTPRGYGAETIVNYVAAAKSVLTWAYENGWILQQPIVPELPKPVRQSRDVPTERVRTALSGLRGNARTILRFIAATGCRPGEARRMRWENVRIDLGVVILSEHTTGETTGDERLIGITPEALEVLKELTPGIGPVFKNRDGDPCTKDGLRSILRRKGIVPCQLRHTSAQTATDNGLPEDAIAAQLGHSNTRTLRRYRKIRAARLAAVAANFRIVRPA